MGLPYERNTDYVPGSTPKIQAVDLNALQDDDVDFQRLVAGRDWHREDDFDGSAIDTGLWSLSSSGGGAAPAIGFESGASGYAVLGATGSDGASSLATVPVSPLLKDFRLSGWVKCPQIGGASSSMRFGFGAGPYFELRIDLNGGKWFIVDGINTFNTAIARPAAAYSFLDIRRTGGLFEFFIDSDDPVYSVAQVFSIYDAIVLFADRGTSGTTEMRIDSVKGWHRR